MSGSSVRYRWGDWSPTGRVSQAESSRRHREKKPGVGPRLDLHVFEELKRVADQRGISPTKLAQILITEGLGFEVEDDGGDE